ncbi:MAG: EAL domain-containing protein [Sphingomonas sp.]
MGRVTIIDPEDGEPYAAAPFRPGKEGDRGGAIDAAEILAALSAGQEAGSVSMPWRAHCTIEIENFAQLRRHVGVARAARFIPQLAKHISRLVAGVCFGAPGQRSLEFSFAIADAERAELALAAVKASLDALEPVDSVPHRLELALAGVVGPADQSDHVRVAEELEDALLLARTERRIVCRDVSVDSPAFDKLSLIRDLSTALSGEEMFLQYQPKIHVRNRTITSAEALIRWQHPTRGLVSPGEFIPAAEESRQVRALTLWTLEKVIADQISLRDAGHDLEIFINISGQLLSDGDFIREAGDRIRQSGARIGLEITETSVIRDPETAISHLRHLDKIGIPIAIDDYGAGLSSLAYLKQLPARELKIDKMFVTQLTSSNRDPLIVRSTIDLAHALEMEVTAEGVESQAALALLTVMGCDMVQGFLISEPISLQALKNYLENEHPFSEDAARGSFIQPASFWKRA